MKKLFLLAVSAFAVNMQCFSQNCDFVFHTGSVISMSANTWTNPLLTDMKFIKAKEEKQDEKIAEYNANVVSGVIKPAAYDLTYRCIEDTPSSSMAKSFTLTTTIGGKDYSSYLECYGDTLYFYRIKGVQAIDINGEKPGFSLMGAQKIPRNLKVGDSLPTFEDVSMLYLKSTDLTVKEAVYAGLKTSTTTGVGAYINSSTGNVGNGLYTKTTTSAAYNMIDVKVRQTLSLSSHTVHYMNTVVSRTEDISVGGRQYKAFVIESETWTKGKTEGSYESARESVARSQKKLFDKMQGKMDKKMRKMGFLNDDGYMVSYSEEWFVPELAMMVKSRSYDSYGGIAGEIVVSSVK